MRTANPEFESNCPWCGGALTDAARVVAKQMRARMAESASRWRAECQRAQAANTSDPRGAATHSEQVAPLRSEAEQGQPRIENLPSPIEVHQSRVDTRETEGV